MAQRREADTILSSTITSHPENKDLIEGATIKLRIAEINLKETRNAVTKVETLITNMDRLLTQSSALRIEAGKPGIGKPSEKRELADRKLKDAGALAADITAGVNQLKQRWLIPRTAVELNTGTPEE